MARTFIFNFDGTCNDPSDAEQAVDSLGQLEDSSITNVLKLHLLCGGSLGEQGRGWDNNQRSYYYAGIGAYGNAMQQAINAIFAPEGSDVAQILKRALIDFTRANFNPEQDILLVTGFSRGAALARRFAAILARTITTPSIYEAVFDTVASIGGADLQKEDRPKTDVLFENCSLPEIVIQALHLVALDEKRSAFQPTLMNQQDKVHEVWFAGAHADVGGGYHQDGLSDNALQYCLQWLDDQPFPLTVKRHAAVDYRNILPANADYQISADDVVIKPDPLGRNHQQQRGPLSGLITCDHRLCCVIENDTATTQAPLVHHSVATRIHAAHDYRPVSLKGRPHKLLTQDGSKLVYQGINPHIELPIQNLRRLDVDTSVTVTVFAAEKFNRTGLVLIAGEHYQFEVLPKQSWRDADIQCDANGWNRSTVSLGPHHQPFAVYEPLRRLPNVNWLALCGAIGANENELFPIGLESSYTPRKSGEFCPFANDLPDFYGNNAGKMLLKVTRLLVGEEMRTSVDIV
ncbi:T6SS phospholipase effector Tle1-like catalytic domain-containing protein [Corallincola luteus]|nr:DUF2235 domain-containing protein [Corallincola luteus]